MASRRNVSIFYVSINIQLYHLISLTRTVIPLVFNNFVDLEAWQQHNLAFCDCSVFYILLLNRMDVILQLNNLYAPIIFYLCRMQSFLLSILIVYLGIAEKRSSKLVRSKFNIHFKNQFNQKTYLNFFLTCHKFNLEAVFSLQILFPEQNK